MRASRAAGGPPALHSLSFASMNSALTPSRNILLASIWTVLVLVVSFVSGSKVLAAISIGALFGLVAGFFQNRALSDSRDALLATVTFDDVTIAMKSTRSGRLASWTNRLGALAILAAASFVGRNGFVPAFVSGYFALMAARDWRALPGVMRLGRGD